MRTPEPACQRHTREHRSEGPSSAAGIALLSELLSEPAETSFGTPDVAEPVDIFVIDDFIDHRGTELAEPGESVVDVLDGEHHTQVSHDHWMAFSHSPIRVGEYLAMMGCQTNARLGSALISA